jgi:hypothetical protein
VAFCRSCNAVIEWHKTPAGKNIPLDPDPHPQGNLTFDDALRVVYMRPGSKPKMYRSHFATCPNAAQHRKPREPQETRACFTCGEVGHLAKDCPDRPREDDGPDDDQGGRGG